jgi:hypothetical protein
MKALLSEVCLMNNAMWMGYCDVTGDPHCTRPWSLVSVSSSSGGPPLCYFWFNRVDTVAAPTGISYLSAGLGQQLALCPGGCKHLERCFGSWRCAVISLIGHRKDGGWGWSNLQDLAWGSVHCSPDGGQHSTAIVPCQLGVFPGPSL